MSRPLVVVAEEIALAGLARLRERYDVDDASGAPRAELLTRVAAAHALIVRSATRVDPELMAAAPKLRVVGRAGTGVDNVDVAAATRAGIIVVNAPQSNSLSTAEHTMALLLAQARNVAAADRSLRGGEWARSRYQGVELYGKTLGILGLGRVGTLVAQRASAFGMRLVAWDPWMSRERARQLGVELRDSVDDVLSEADFVTIHLLKSPESTGLLSAERLAKMKQGARIFNASRGGIVDEAALAEAIASGHLGGAGLDVFAAEPMTESALFSLDDVVVTPHLGASTVEAQDKAGVTIAEQVDLALRGEFVPFAVNVAAGEVAETLQPFLPLAEILGRLYTAYASGLPSVLEISYQGTLADHDTRVLTLMVLKGLFTDAVSEPVTLVNAPLLAQERGVEVRETTTATSTDYVNLIRLAGMPDGQPTSVGGTLTGKRETPEIVEIDGHTVTCPPSRHMLVVRNDDRPGMIAHVGTVCRDRGINISDMDVGRDPDGTHALMVLAINQAVSREVVDEITAADGILDCRAISLEGI